VLSFYGEPDPAGDAFLPADPAAEPPPEGEEGVPAVGDEFVFTDRLYALGGTPEAPARAGEQIGHVSVRCVVSQVFEAEEDAASTCTGVFSIDGRGDVTAQGMFRFSEFEDQGFATLGLTGGTGEFYDAGGELEVREFTDDDPTNDEEESFPAVYELRILHLAEGGHSS
jgi:hypothetical protein